MPRPIVPPIDWGAIGRGLADAGRGLGRLTLRAAGPLSLGLWPSNGFSNDKPGECYGTLTCAARPVYNESSEGDGTPENALDADQTDEELEPKIDSVTKSRDTVRGAIRGGDEDAIDQAARDYETIRDRQDRRRRQERRFRDFQFEGDDQ